jgi:hypothetical protein
MGLLHAFHCGGQLIHYPVRVYHKACESLPGACCPVPHKTRATSHKNDVRDRYTRMRVCEPGPDLAPLNLISMACICFKLGHEPLLLYRRVDILYSVPFRCLPHFTTRSTTPTETRERAYPTSYSLERLTRLGVYFVYSTDRKRLPQWSPF